MYSQNKLGIPLIIVNLHVALVEWDKLKVET